MKADITLDLREFVDALREYCKSKVGYEIGAIYISSYDKVRIAIDEFDLVECEEFRHRA